MRLGSDSAPDVVIVPGTGVAQSAGRLDMTLGSTARIFELGSYVRALSGFGSLDYRLCLWGWGGSVGASNALLGRTAVHTVSPAASAPANLLRVTWPLEDPVEVGPFWELLVGVAWETDPAHQMLLGGYSGSGLRYRKDLAAGAGWPVSMKDSVALTDHNVAGWIEEFEPASGIWVYRDGEWTELDTDSVLVERGGVQHPAEVRVRRSGVWVRIYG